MTVKELKHHIVDLPDDMRVVGMMREMLGPEFHDIDWAEINPERAENTLILGGDVIMDDDPLYR